jgi:hypothetical protein
LASAQVAARPAFPQQKRTAKLDWTDSSRKTVTLFAEKRFYMKRILFGVAVALAGLTLTSNVEASGHPGHPVISHARRPVVVRPYFEGHARHFSGGYYYAGREHHHWTRTVWDSHYHRYQYWDPGLNCWFYWYAPGNCYYPVSYCP